MRIIETPLYAWQVQPLALMLFTLKTLCRHFAQRFYLRGPLSEPQAALKMSVLPIRGIRDFLSTTSSVVPVDSSFGHD